MSVVTVHIGPPPAEVGEVFDLATYTPEVVPDFDVLAESARCSCNASDDNPY